MALADKINGILDKVGLSPYPYASLGEPAGQVRTARPSGGATAIEAPKEIQLPVALKNDVGLAFSAWANLPSAQSGALDNEMFFADGKDLSRPRQVVFDMGSSVISISSQFPVGELKLSPQPGGAAIEFDLPGGARAVVVPRDYSVNRVSDSRSAVVSDPGKYEFAFNALMHSLRTNSSIIVAVREEALRLAKDAGSLGVNLPVYDREGSVTVFDGTGMQPRTWTFSPYSHGISTFNPTTCRQECAPLDPRVSPYENIARAVAADRDRKHGPSSRGSSAAIDTTVHRVLPGGYEVLLRRDIRNDVMYGSMISHSSSEGPMAVILPSNHKDGIDGGMELLNEYAKAMTSKKEAVAKSVISKASKRGQSAIDMPNGEILHLEYRLDKAGVPSIALASASGSSLAELPVRLACADEKAYIKELAASAAKKHPSLMAASTAVPSQPCENLDVSDINKWLMVCNNEQPLPSITFACGDKYEVSAVPGGEDQPASVALGRYEDQAFRFILVQTNLNKGESFDDLMDRLRNEAIKAYPELGRDSRDEHLPIDKEESAHWGR